MSADPIDLALRILDANGAVTVISGAGMSTGSDIIDYRGRNGLGAASEDNNLGAFLQDPKSTWTRWQQQLVSINQAEPTDGHHALAWLARNGYVSTLITQNIDRLHWRAGHPSHWEAHGRVDRLRCAACSARAMLSEHHLWNDTVPYCTECVWGEQSPMRLDVVMPGEEVNLHNLSTARERSAASKLVIIIGSSMAVPPISRLPQYALTTGGEIAVINEGPCEWDHVAWWHSQGKAEHILPLIVDTLVSIQQGQ